jgi:hypothetical protein
VSRLTAALTEGLTEGRGTIDTIAAWFPIDAAVVRAMLPRRLSVTPNARGQCRALVLLSEHQFHSWFAEMRYHELTFVLTDIDSGSGRLNQYLRRLYLDRALPRVLGNRIYGFEKLAATIRWDRTCDRYLVEDQQGRGILDASFEPGEPVSAIGLAKSWAVLEQPIVSQAARRWSARAALDHGGPYLTSELRFDSRAATPRAVRGRLTFGPRFDPAALAGRTLDLEPLDAEGFGAVAWQTTEVVTLPRRA